MTSRVPSSEAKAVVSLVERFRTEVAAISWHEPFRVEREGIRVEPLVVMNGPDVRDDICASGNSISFVDVILQALMRC